MAGRTILYVHSSDEMYGADLILLQLLERLPEAGFRPLVVVPTDVSYDGQLTRALAARGIAHVHYPTAVLRRRYFRPLGLLTYLWRLAASTWFLARLIRRERAGLVHSNTAAVIPGALAARLTGVPHIWHIHEIITRPRFLWRLTAWLVPRLSEAVVAVSTPTWAHLCAGSARNRERAIVIHNGIDSAPFAGAAPAGRALRRDWGVADDEALVLMVGRFSHWKGQGHFLEAAAHVAQSHAQARFALVGGVFPGQEALVDEAKALAASLGLGDRALFSGFRDDIPAVLAAADVFVLPSTSPDPFPTVVLEAMAAGRPVVANAHGGSVEMVVDGETGLLVDPADPEAMAAAIVALLDAPARRHAMGLAGRQRLEATFSPEAFWERWRALYEALGTAAPESLDSPRHQ